MLAQAESLVPRVQGQKHKAKNTIHDKEHLHDEVMRLRQLIQNYRQENAQLKAEFDHYNQDVERQDLLIHNLTGQLSAAQGAALSPSRYKAEPHLIAALKKQSRELHEELKAKEDEIKELQTNPKITKIQELEVEMQTSAEEGVRLRQMVEELATKQASKYTKNDIAEMEENIYQQNILLSSMREENTQLTRALEKKAAELQQWKDQAAEIEKKTQQYQNEARDNNRIKRSIKAVKQDVHKCKDQLAKLRLSAKDHDLVSYQRRIDELFEKQTTLTEQLEHSQKKVAQLEAQAKSISSSPNDPSHPNPSDADVTALQEQLAKCMIDLDLDLT
jgi:chromosome segregation ATPase